MKGLVVILSIFVAVIGSASSRRLLGGEKCTWGPSYWCSGLQQSSKCQATRHCIDKVWSSNPYPEDDDDVCTICKNMVKEARDQLQSNETQEELKQVFEGSCALIPVKVIANECKKLVDEFVPELVETLSSEMNPDTVCSVAGLCNSKWIDKLLQKFHKEQLLKSDCDVCKEQAKKLSAQLYDADKDLVLDKLLQICGYAGSYSDACRLMVLEDYDDIYDVLIHLDDGLCDLSGMCPASSSSQVSTFNAFNRNPSDIQCEFCEKVIQHWINTWTANTTEAEFKQVLEALCHKLKPERVDHCLHIVDDYYIPWFNYILHELNPQTACKIMGLCGSNGDFLSVENAPITLLLTREPEAPVAEDNNRLIGGYFAPQTAVYMEKPGCVICEYVVNELQKLLGNNQTEAEIEEALEKVCNYMPASVGAQCDHLVETYGPAIVEILSRGVDPKDVCTLMKLCDPSEAQLLGISEDNPIVEMKQKDDNCAICQYAMTTLFGIIKDKDNRAEIKNALESLCRVLPSSIEDQCESYIDAYAEKIIELIADNLTADEVCAELRLCSKVEKSLTLNVQDSKCVLCEYVMSILDETLANKTTEAEIREALEKVCHRFPESLQNQCTSFVDKYADVIIDFLTHQLPPEAICKQIGMCQTSVNNGEQFEMMLESSRIIEQDQDEPRPYCTLCEYAIGEVDKLITDKQNEEEIKSVLDRICYELSAPIQKECLNMVNKYTDEIIDMFVAEYTPQQVCAQLGLCNPPKAEIQSNDITRFDDVQDSGPVCVLCEFAMHILEKQLVNNRTMDMAEHAILMLCSYMPESIADKCIDFVQQYGDEIIDLIIRAEMNPDQVCAALTLCTSDLTTWDASPLGGRECTWGPAFWCQSPIHARACGTLKHCQENVWNNE